MKVYLNFLSSVIILGSGFFLSAAQRSPQEREAAATNQLIRAALEMTERCLEEVESLEDWESRRPELQQQLRYMLGLDPLPERTPLNARITGRIEREQYSIEKIVFESLPGLYVTGNFYVPRDAGESLPTILYLCGHSPHPLGAKFHYQDRAAWFAANGYACLILDTLEFGEVAGIHHGTHNLNMWHWLSLGYTPAGLEVWNAMRALDYLETRPEADMNRVGLTGISGGGAITWFTAAVDGRVSAAVPVCSTYTFGSQAENWLADGQCDCIYYHNTFEWDFPIVGALIAPRPLLILSGERDGIFPPDGYHPVYRKSKRVFDLYAGKDSDRIREFDADVGHSDPPEFLREARQWMQRWLKGDESEVPLNPPSLPEESAGDLAVLDSLPEDAANFSVQDFFTEPVVLEAPTSRSAWLERREQLIAELKDKVFRWFPEQPVAFETESGNAGAGWADRYADYREVTFQTEEGVRIRGQLMTPKNNASDAPLLIYVKRAGDSLYFMDLDELLPVMGRYSVLVLYPRFTERKWTPSEFANVERTAVWTGRTIAALQVWDVLRSVEWIASESGLNPGSISLYGKGDMGIVGLYAALFEERIQQVILNDPPATHWKSPALLNVLRFTDIPEVAAALAPRELSVVGLRGNGFDLTRSVYGTMNTEGNMTSPTSLPEALEIWKWPGPMEP